MTITRPLSYTSKAVILAAMLILLAPAPSFSSASSSVAALVKGQHDDVAAASAWQQQYPCLSNTAVDLPRHEGASGQQQQQRINSAVAAYLRTSYTRYHKAEKLGIMVPMPMVVSVPSGAEVVVCLNRKVASTQWRLLFLKSAGWDPDTVSVSRNPESERSREWKRLHLWEGIDSADAYVDKVLREHRRRSFLFVRNPYARLLSAFLHKVASARAKGCYTLTHREFDACPHPTGSAEVQRYEKSRSAFSAFVGNLYSHFKAGRMESVNNHIKPLSLQCGLQHGLRYSHILKVEEMELWYPELIRFWGMEEVVASGWAKLFSPDELHPERIDCFFHPAWATCAEMNETVHTAGTGRECRKDGGEAGKGTSAYPDKPLNERPGHYTGANSQVSLYYTQRVAKMVQEMYQQDFDMFGYDPVLDSVSPTGSRSR